MAILIDAPLWPAHGMLWSHLVSDSSYAELHEFARASGLARRSFDLDHYDVPETRYASLIAAGAIAVDPRELVHRLRGSGLRVKSRDREALRPARRLAYLAEEWRGLPTLLAAEGSAPQIEGWLSLGDELIDRWAEPHRAYHTLTHLEDVLLALDQLSIRGEAIAVETLLAAWFHDAVYTGRGNRDERDSAGLAVARLDSAGLDPQLSKLVGELVIETIPGGAGAAGNEGARHLLDADLAIFAAPTSRYTEYREAVRSEYAHVPEDQFREGRSRILDAYLERERIYATVPAHELWEGRARANLAAEVKALRAD
ncbi:DUF4031 domain-containing protein [Leucobacter chinensis]|uniref:DUF4031 domain-containing protein n=1 Tax=Leucobacter chinensis TaxID=2851010 RepID=UPI001C232CD0|nr:DUF4031 domain-containing protein [Leucobacter chinensis]